MQKTADEQMKDKKNTDNVFREKLESFSATPPPYIWENVKGQLAAKRSKTRKIYIGWISTAAIVVLAFLAGWYFNEKSPLDEKVTVENKTTLPALNSPAANSQISENAEQNNPEVLTNQNQPGNPVLLAFQESSIHTKVNTPNPAKTNTMSAGRLSGSISAMKSIKAKVTPIQLPKVTLKTKAKTLPPDYLTVSDKLLVAENIKMANNGADSDNNWKLGMYLAPGYSSYSANHTESYAQNMTYSGSGGNANVSGGVSLQYKTSKRWIIESGVYYAQNGQESANPANLFARSDNLDYGIESGDNAYFSNVVKVGNNNLAMNSTAGVIELAGTPKGAELSADFEAMKSDVSNLIVPNGSFSQVFDFMEIPVFVRYRLIDSKFGVEMITGLNAGIVVGNNAYIDNQFGVQNIGETKDISTVNLSGTFGFGLNYALGKHFAVAIEPRFNYYLNSINSNSAVDFRPYRIGFYTGVSYEF